MATQIDPNLKEAVHARTDAAAQAAHDLVERAARTAEATEEKLRNSAGQAQRAMHDSLDTARVRGMEAQETVMGFVRRHPLASVGIAFGIGALLAVRSSRATRRMVADGRDASMH